MFKFFVSDLSGFKLGLKANLDWIDETSRLCSIGGGGGKWRDINFYYIFYMVEHVKGDGLEMIKLSWGWYLFEVGVMGRGYQKD